MASKNTTLDDLSAVVGFSATVKLAAWFGGTNVWVPNVVEEGQVLVRLIGLSSAKRLAKEWGLTHVAVPPLTAYKLEMRRRMVGRLLEKGFSTSEIARMTQISERRAQQICRELEQEGMIEPVEPKVGRKRRGENGGENPPAKTPLKTPQAKRPLESPGVSLTR